MRTTPVWLGRTDAAKDPREPGIDQGIVKHAVRGDHGLSLCAILNGWGRPDPAVVEDFVAAFPEHSSEVRAWLAIAAKDRRSDGVRLSQEMTAVIRAEIAKSREIIASAPGWAPAIRNRVEEELLVLHEMEANATRRPSLKERILNAARAHTVVDARGRRFEYLALPQPDGSMRSAKSADACVYYKTDGKLGNFQDVVRSGIRIKSTESLAVYLADLSHRGAGRLEVSWKLPLPKGLRNDPTFDGSRCLRIFDCDRPMTPSEAWGRFAASAECLFERRAEFIVSDPMRYSAVTRFIVDGPSVLFSYAPSERLEPRAGGRFTESVLALPDEPDTLADRIRAGVVRVDRNAAAALTRAARAFAMRDRTRSPIVLDVGLVGARGEVFAASKLFGLEDPFIPMHEVLDAFDDIRESIVRLAWRRAVDQSTAWSSLIADGFAPFRDAVYRHIPKFHDGWARLRSNKGIDYFLDELRHERRKEDIRKARHAAGETI